MHTSSPKGQGSNRQTKSPLTSANVMLKTVSSILNILRKTGGYINCSKNQQTNVKVKVVPEDSEKALMTQAQSPEPTS